MAQAWVQRDTKILEQILADDYTLGGAGDSLINKEEYVPGLMIQKAGCSVPGSLLHIHFAEFMDHRHHEIGGIRTRSQLDGIRN